MDNKNNVDIDLVQETEQLISHCEAEALKWKARAEGARLLYTKLVAKVQNGQKEQKEDSGNQEERKK